MFKCGSCNIEITQHGLSLMTGCSICHKECHEYCTRDPNHVQSTLPGLEKALLDINGYICISCISNLELQIIDTLPLIVLPKYLTYPFKNEQGRVRLIERIENHV